MKRQELAHARLQTPHPKAGISGNRSHWKDFKKRMNMMEFVSHSGKLLCCCMEVCVPSLHTLFKFIGNSLKGVSL